MSERMRFSRPINRIAIIIAVSIFFTSSFDIFLVLEAGGNYRFCQILTAVLVPLAIVKAVRGGMIPTLGFFPLCVWLGFQIAFIPATEFWPKSLGYCFWLLLNLGLVFAYVQLFSDNSKLLTTILRWYVRSFAVIAGFGIVQFILPVLGLGGLLVTQWWIPGFIARVNGFSYEPSYFATYLLIGFVLTGSLRRNRSSLLSPRALLAVHWILGIGIVLSSSRMGIVMLFVDVLSSQLSPWVSFFSDLRRLRIFKSKLRQLIPSLVSLTLMGSLAAGTSIALERNPSLALIFLNGTGISDTAAHSVIQRADALEETLAVFVEQPLMGRSLGGISWAIADLQGERIDSFAASKQFEGMSVFAEALAASGLIGVIPFVWFLITTFRKPLRLARVTVPFCSVLLKGLIRSLFFAWMALQFNQNMLRPYLWTHIAILAAVYAAALQSTDSSARAGSTS
jgi:hypothetical protein